jgi:hypothetical protein
MDFDPSRLFKKEQPKPAIEQAPMQMPQQPQQQEVEQPEEATDEELLSQLQNIM